MLDMETRYLIAQVAVNEINESIADIEIILGGMITEEHKELIAALRKTSKKLYNELEF